MAPRCPALVPAGLRHCRPLPGAAPAGARTRRRRAGSTGKCGACSEGGREGGCIGATGCWGLHAVTAPCRGDAQGGFIAGLLMASGPQSSPLSLLPLFKYAAACPGRRLAHISAHASPAQPSPVVAEPPSPLRRLQLVSGREAQVARHLRPQLQPARQLRLHLLARDAAAGQQRRGADELCERYEGRHRRVRLQRMPSIVPSDASIHIGYYVAVYAECHTIWEGGLSPASPAGATEGAALPLAGAPLSMPLALVSGVPPAAELLLPPRRRLFTNVDIDVIVLKRPTGATRQQESGGGLLL